MSRGPHPRTRAGSLEGHIRLQNPEKANWRMQAVFKVIAQAAKLFLEQSHNTGSGHVEQRTVNLNWVPSKEVRKVPTKTGINSVLDDEENVPLQELLERRAKRRKCSVEDRQPLLIERSGPCAKRKGDDENSSDNEFVQPPKRRAITQWPSYFSEKAPEKSDAIVAEAQFTVMQTVNEINSTSDPLLFANDGAANTLALAEYHGELLDVVDNVVEHDFMTLADGMNMLLQYPAEDAASFDPEILDSLRNENFEKELCDQRVFANDGGTNTPALAEYHGELDFMTLADDVNMLLQNPDDIVHPPADATNFEIEDTTIEEDLDVNTTDGKVGKQWYTSKSRQWNKFSHLEEAIYTICEDKIHAKFDEIPLVGRNYSVPTVNELPSDRDKCTTFYVGVWSSRKKLNLVPLLDFIMPKRRYQLAFCWDQSHCTTTELHTVDNIDKPVMLKELVKLWDKDDPNLPWERREYNESNTVMLDDSPYKALFNSPHTAIFPTSYDFQNENDNSLGPGGDIRMYLEGLATSKNVQKYIEQHPFGQQALTESDPSWPHYLQLNNSRLHAPSNPGL
ncbi:hypothetical protein IFM89_011386 [Coptis chinensis]|uniref:Mitochondrial import inner membrane translocase subunit TIM50 n=1 Tax=Coptis chinensis TaxID=261450 RepID=A0A835HXI1_9MAGN|nr:hypothetical protein IFM89_011386 [Coptis chinensis]